ncbi:MAG: hypothetical protein KKB70_07895 [Proteobacteria bacterium]|nr:hypothetical protein [Pseudomonadota bacterium]
MPKEITAAQVGDMMKTLESEILKVCSAMTELVDLFQKTFPMRPQKNGWTLVLVSKSKAQRGRFDPFEIHWKRYYWYSYPETRASGLVKTIWKWNWLTNNPHRAEVTINETKDFPGHLNHLKPATREIFRAFHKRKIALVARRNHLVEVYERVRKTLAGNLSKPALQKTSRLIDELDEFRYGELRAFLNTQSGREKPGD